jgi:5'-3' exonuclease
MDIYLVDGTYELFRHFFALPSLRDEHGREVGAVRGVLNSMKSLLEHDSKYLGVATDHVIESFRNDLYTGYKTSAGVPPDLLSQFPILEDDLRKMGVVVWPMVEFEADDALASAAVKAAQDSRVDRVVICTPDKDLGQCVSGTRIVQLNRRTRTILEEEHIVEKFGVKPQSIPDYLALVGDSADGYPGVPGWGKKAAATVLSVYGHIEGIPSDWREWSVALRNPSTLAASLRTCWEDALLFRTLATLRTDVPVFNSVDELLWRGGL